MNSLTLEKVIVAVIVIAIAVTVYSALPEMLHHVMSQAANQVVPK